MSDLERRALLGAAGLVGVAALAGRAKGGPLTPPAGAVAPSGRTLDEIYNRVAVAGAADGRIPIPGGTSGVTIGAPGSYVLTGNLLSNGVTLTISASDVTLDLNGYTISTSSTASNSRAISMTANRARITIRNGRVTGGDAAIGTAALGGGLLTDVIFEDLNVTDTRSSGIAMNVTGVDRVIVRRCSVLGVGVRTSATDALPFLGGINVGGSNCRVEDCSVGAFAYNGTGVPVYRGISMASGIGAAGNLIARCTVSNITAVTGDGIRFFGAGVYRDNTVMNFSAPYVSGTNGGGNV